jgi:hypothetical protein
MMMMRCGVVVLGVGDVGDGGEGVVVGRIRLITWRMRCQPWSRRSDFPNSA